MTTSSRFQHLRDAALCLSTANLLFLRSWEELFRLCSMRLPGPTDDAWIPAAFVRPVGRGTLAFFLGTLISVLLLAGALWLTAGFSRRTGDRWPVVCARCGFLFLIVTPTDFLCWKLFVLTQTHFSVSILKLAWSLVILVPMMGCLQMILFHRDGLYRVIRKLVLILWPLLPLSTLQVAGSFFTSGKAPAAELSGMFPRISERRVIWMVFDELDQRMAFEERPSSIQLPESDRLLAESFYATKAASPSWDTTIAMASLLTGRLVQNWNTISAPTKLVFESGEVDDFTSLPTVLTEARAAGFNTALAGWLVPYCSVLAASLSACEQPTADNLKPGSITKNIQEVWHQQLDEHWLVVRFSTAAQSRVPWFGWATRKEQYIGYRYIKEHARGMVTDPRAGLVLLHWPIPHPLGIYDRRRDEISLDRRSNYIDNLELTDRTIGELRQWLEAAGLWAATTLIVTSDHPYRPDAWSGSSSWTKEEADLSRNMRFPYVPFIVKVAGQDRALRYDRPFNTLLSKGLILALLKGEITRAEQVAAWLDANGGNVEQPSPAAASARP